MKFIVFLQETASVISSQKLESQMRDIAYGTKQYKAAATEVNHLDFFLIFGVELSPILSLRMGPGCARNVVVTPLKPSVNPECR